MGAFEAAPRKNAMDWHHTGRPCWAATMLVVLGCATATRAAHAQTDPDDRLFGGPTLERSAYVQAVLDRNRSIESARQAWRAASGRERQTGSLEDPMVTVDVAPLSIASSSARLGWDAMVSQRLPWPGKLALDEAVAHAEAQAARSDFEASRRELALTAAFLFDQYFVAVRSIEVNAHHVELMRSMQAAATSQYEVGRGSAQDPLQAEFELTHMEHDTIILASQRDVTVAQMNELLHRAPELPLPPPPHELVPSPSSDASNEGALETE